MRDIYWEWLHAPGQEHLRLVEKPEAIVAEGVVAGTLESGTFRMHYLVTCDRAWRFRHAEVQLEQGPTRREVHLGREPNGHWRVDGVERLALRSCADIDLMGSPFTNTLPIRNLGLAPDEAREIRVAYVRLPDLAVTPEAQVYTRLDRGEPPRRFRYHGVATGFTADLTVDEAGLVVDYPGIWRRRG